MQTYIREISKHLWCITYFIEQCSCFSTALEYFPLKRERSTLLTVFLNFAAVSVVLLTDLLPSNLSLICISAGNKRTKADLLLFLPASRPASPVSAQEESVKKITLNFQLSWQISPKDWDLTNGHRCYGPDQQNQWLTLQKVKLKQFIMSKF